MKLKKLLSILLAVALVLAMSVSVSASKRVDVNGEIVIGTLEWSGIPKETEYLAATMKMRISDPAYILTATVSGVFTPNSAAPGGGVQLPTSDLKWSEWPGRTWRKNSCRQRILDTGRWRLRCTLWRPV